MSSDLVEMLGEQHDPIAVKDELTNYFTTSDSEPFIDIDMESSDVPHGKVFVAPIQGTSFHDVTRSGRRHASKQSANRSVQRPAQPQTAQVRPPPAQAPCRDDTVKVEKSVPYIKYDPIQRTGSVGYTKVIEVSIEPERLKHEVKDQDDDEDVKPEQPKNDPEEVDPDDALLKKHVCDVCEKGFVYKSLLKRHKMIHSDERPYKCPTCGRGFRNNYNLMCHYTTHEKDQELEAEGGGGGGEKKPKPLLDVEDVSRIFQSMKSMEEVDRKETKQQQCSRKPVKERKPARRRNAITRHICDICSKIFISANLLRRHYMIHTDERPFVCDLCSKSFRHNYNLKSHMLTHTKDAMRRFKCLECDKSFVKRSILNRHKILHTNNYPYACHICGKAFRQNCNLKTHIRMHTNERPYECDICSKTFGHKSHLKLHRMKHSDERNYTCTLCCKCFKTSNTLSKHYKKHLQQQQQQQQQT